ncbi:LLM class flavin-dependent oxidoreductase [Demequina sp. NBRC 110054]|uniref:LLM class flavin-dependent oxidoreductase n=1 Tax=Demequina sp. NBRC 110054 TaxID=1570343 RepID=UPI001F307DDA|nr:LLM class flavin-dependent oxidoreductase [Demequina sp. NBRC 110054]
MTTATVSLGLQTDKRPGTYARLAAQAEAAGFDGVSVFSDLLFQPAIVALSEMATTTRSLRLGCACWNPFTQHPYEIATHAAALADRAPGRAYLGLARGSWLDSIGVTPERPLERLRESVGFIRALLAGTGEGYEGNQLRLAPGTALRSPEGPVELPLLIGSWGPRGVALAGELADELKVGGTANPDLVPVMRERLAVGAARTSRDPSEVGLVFGAVTVVDTDRARARAHARREVAMYLDVVAELDPTVDVSADLLEEIRVRLSRRDEAGAGDLVDDALLDRFAFAGTPDDIAGHAVSLIDAGVDRIEFGTPHGIDEEEGIALLGDAVLPALRAHLTP